MKKIFITLIIALLFSSCSKSNVKEEERRQVKLTLGIRVENASGENLLDPATAGNILGNEIFLVLTDKKYEGYDAGYEGYEGYKISELSRGEWLHPIGFIVDQSIDGTPLFRYTWSSELYWLVRKQEFNYILHLGDDMDYEIKAELKRARDENGRYLFNDEVWINGEVQPDKGNLYTGLTVTIVK